MDARRKFGELGRISTTSFEIAAPKMQTVDEKISKKATLKPHDSQDHELRSPSSNSITYDLKDSNLRSYNLGFVFPL